MAVSLICIVWLVVSLSSCVWLLLIHKGFDFGLKTIISNLFYYGKLRDGEYETAKGISKLLDVPKRYFSHFYLVGVAVNSTVLVLSLFALHQGSKFPDVIAKIMSILYYPNTTKKTHINGILILTVLFMEEVQVFRRLYECRRVHIFSDSYMSVVHYLVGLFFYSVFGLSVVSEVDFRHVESTVQTEDAVLIVVSLLLFLWSSWKQQKAFKILARLRSGSHKDTKKNLGHFVADEDLFQLVSCPHYFTEILVYFSFNLLLRFSNMAAFFCFLFVAVNQVTYGLITHSWYRRTYSFYPKHRRAIIPFLL